MTDFQQRVLNEFNELDEKIEKLDSFIGGEIFLTLLGDEQNRLKLQAEAMQEYSDILAERIEAFE